MQLITLRNLKSEDEQQFLAALQEPWEKGFDFAHYWESLAQKNYDQFINMIPEMSLGLHIPKEHVPCTFLFAFNDEGRLVGRTSIRHRLTDFLLKAGGHIGYGVLPSQRKQGYATDILKQSLVYVREHIPTLERVLVTCDEGNIGSQKTIEKNQGVLENTISTSNGVKKMRYWITL